MQLGLELLAAVEGIITIIYFSVTSKQGVVPLSSCNPAWFHPAVTAAAGVKSIAAAPGAQAGCVQLIQDNIHWHHPVRTKLITDGW